MPCLFFHKWAHALDFAEYFIVCRDELSHRSHYISRCISTETQIFSQKNLQEFTIDTTRSHTGVLQAQSSTVPAAPPIRLPIPNPNPNPKKLTLPYF